MVSFALIGYIVYISQFCSLQITLQIRDFSWKIRLGCHLSNQGMWAETDRRRFWVESESRIVRRASPQQATTKSASEMTIKLNDTILGGCAVDPDMIGDEKLSLKVNEQVLTKLQIWGSVTNTTNTLADRRDSGPWTQSFLQFMCTHGHVFSFIC